MRDCDAETKNYALCTCMNLSQNKFKKWSLEMSQWLKHLPCKHENLSLNPQNPHTKQDRVTASCDPCNLAARWEIETGEFPDICGPATLLYVTEARRSLLKIRWKVRTDTRNCFLTFICMPSLTQTCTHRHTNHTYKQIQRQKQQNTRKECISHN